MLTFQQSNQLNVCYFVVEIFMKNATHATNDSYVSQYIRTVFFSVPHSLRIFSSMCLCVDFEKWKMILWQSFYVRFRISTNKMDMHNARTHSSQWRASGKVNKVSAILFEMSLLNIVLTHDFTRNIYQSFIMFSFLLLLLFHHQFRGFFFVLLMRCVKQKKRRSCLWAFARRKTTQNWSRFMNEWVQCLQTIQKDLAPPEMTF